MAERMTLLPLTAAVGLWTKQQRHHEWECLLCPETGGAATPDEAEQRAVEHLRLDHRGVTSR